MTRSIPIKSHYPNITSGCSAIFEYSVWCAITFMVLVGIACLVWGPVGLAALAGALAGLSLPLLLGESAQYRDDGLNALRWKWDGSPNDDGNPAGRDIFEEWSYRPSCGIDE
jgi:hypothetical protein